MNLDVDVCALLPSVRVPTLVMHRPELARAPVESSRYMAQRIPGARLVEFPGRDLGPPFGDQEGLFSELETFLADAAEEKERTADWTAYSPPFLFTAWGAQTRSACSGGVRGAPRREVGRLTAAERNHRRRKHR